jgi:hypothetical protein
MVAMIAMPVPVSAQMQITNVSDVSFGTITNVSADVSQSQTVCAYSGLFSGRYNITATGSGAAGAFTLTNGAATLAYDVQWNALAGQTSGTMLSTGAALTGLLSYAVLPTCTLGVTPSGTLTITLRSAALSSAAAGNFTGTLSLMISPN